jgi:hypothetical protein
VWAQLTVGAAADYASLPLAVVIAEVLGSFH